MTTVAWDGETLACDAQATYGNVRYSDEKMFLVNDGIAVTVGDCDHSNMIIEWLLSERHKDDYPSMKDEDQGGRVILLTKDKEILLYGGRYHLPSKFKDKFFAAGSGRELALGAMHAGTTAVGAIKIANTLDIGSGMGVYIGNIDEMTISKNE